jgi:hypothetical protein
MEPTMTEDTTIQMRTTQEQSGDYRVYAAKGDDPIKGLALHTDLLERLDGEPEHVAVTVSEDGAVALDAEKFTGSTFRLSNEPAVRHAYVTPAFAQSFGMESEDVPTEETFDTDAFPSIGISNLEVSDEQTYDEEQNSSAEDAAEALFGEESESEESEQEEADADESADEPAEESEADESEEDEDVEISDEEIGIAQ